MTEAGPKRRVPAGPAPGARLIVTAPPVVTGLLIVTGLLLMTGFLAGCGNGDGGPEPALGGGLTRNDATRNAFSHPALGLSNEERRQFEVGDSFFTKNWVTAPASTDVRDGLGPTFNAQACSSCHTLDGRGAPPGGPEDTAATGLLLRLSVPGAAPGAQPLPEPTYGDQLQDRAVLGVPPEGRMVVNWESVTGRYDDGREYTLRRPRVTIAEPAFGPLADDVLVSPRLAPQVMGVGLLEAVPETDIRSREDPDDADGDGISGRANLVPEPGTGRPQLGRFGWKANVPRVENQIAGAFHGDIGITSRLFPEQNCGPGQDACRAAPGGGSPEADDSVFGRVVFYNRTLAVPAMRDHKAGGVRSGARRFEAIGCSSCHVGTLRTGPSDIGVLADQTFHPFTDLLLHDMGDGLADGRPDFRATGREWRTPPLWGLGLLETVNGHRFLLHDGRARTIEEAILWHGGEAEASIRRFKRLSAKERRELVTFLDAL